MNKSIIKDKARLLSSLKSLPLFSSIAFCAALLLAACSSEEAGVTPEPPGKGESEEVTLQIKFPSEGTPSSKALTDANEKMISTLRVFVFAEAGGSRSADKFLYEVPSGTLVKVADSIWSADITLQKIADKQRIVLVANPHASATLPTPTAGMTTVADMFNNITYAASLWHATSTGSYPVFPMWGQMKEGAVFNTGTPPSEININMFRTLARVDVGVDMDNQSSLANDFKIEKVHVYAKPASYLTPHSDYMQSATGIDTEIFTNPRPAAGDIAVYAYAVASPYKEITNTIYIPESDASTTTTPQTYLVVEAKWKGKTGFYRIDFAKADANGTAFIPVIRNHAYRINITNVKTDGYGTLDEAKNAKPDLIGKDLTVEGVNDNINEIVYNETDWLGVSASEILFDWDKMLVGNITQATKNEYDLSVCTSYGSWKATKEGTDSWFEIVGSTGGTQTPEVPFLLKIRVKEDNHTGKERQGKITLRAGMLSLTLTVRQSGGANSHLVRFTSGSSASVTIPVAFAREALGGTLDLTDVHARVLWREFKEGSTSVAFTAELGGSSGKETITVNATTTATSYNTGNAVVALVKGNGIGWVGSGKSEEILWSWHIWSMSDVTDQDRDFHKHGYLKFMSNVLGGHTGYKGMFYQWGRKDPFPEYPNLASPRRVVIEPFTVANTEAYVIQHPTTFYTGTQWLTGGVPATRWTAPTGGSLTKATYTDPCPTGWRVPVDSEKPEWNDSLADYHFSGSLSGSDGTWDGSTHRLWIAAFGATWDTSGSGNTPASPAPGTNTTPGHNIRCIKDIKLVR